MGGSKTCRGFISTRHPQNLDYGRTKRERFRGTNNKVSFIIQMYTFEISLYICLFFIYMYGAISVNRTSVYPMFVTKRFCEDEHMALESLRRTYQCTCGRNAYHFPKVLQVKDGRIWLTHCGTSLDKVPFSSLPRDKMEQARCINKNLRRANIAHMDVSRANICLSRNGVVSLIDFDSVYLPNSTVPGTNICGNNGKAHGKLHWTSENLNTYMKNETDYVYLSRHLGSKRHPKYSSRRSV